ncbi:MAG TPA: class F sortase [Actinoplanes sp.]|nr:class F sortase [Actinoplanes sp.]
MSIVTQGAPLRRALLLILTGMTLLAAFAVAACRSQPEPSFGGPTVTAIASSAPPAPAGPSVAVRKGALPSAGTDVEPARLDIPELRLRATVSAVGIDRGTGDFAVPPSVDRVGWYKFGPGFQATAGSIVIAGHVDSATQGKGAFFRLGSLEDGDRITLYDRNETAREFRVVARERYAKTKIPLNRYFARDGQVRLTLITCGGPFDARTGHYRDNVVVTAEPVAAR